MLGDLKKMTEEDKRIKIEINMDSSYDVTNYYDDHYLYNIRLIVRYFAIYDYFYNISHTSESTRDYFNLLTLQLRKFFSPRMERKHVIGSKKYNLNDYELTFAQWIEYYNKIVGTDDFSDNYHLNNQDQILISRNNLIDTLVRYNKIYSDNHVKNENHIIEHSLKNRIYNYSSKFVAHDTGLRRIEEFENNNSVFVSNSEMFSIVELFSTIEEQYRIFRNHFTNITIISNESKERDLKSKILQYQLEFQNDMKPTES